MDIKLYKCNYVEIVNCTLHNRKALSHIHTRYDQNWDKL